MDIVKIILLALLVTVLMLEVALPVNFIFLGWVAPTQVFISLVY